MHTAPTEPTVDLFHWAATDPVDSIHDYNIPIPPFKHSPTKEDLQKSRRQRKERGSETEPPEPHSSNSDGHVDDYA